MSMSPVIARRLTISGRVQGVGFRYALADEARVRRLSGWVRNRRDGTVEALIAGPEAEVEALVAWARRGPPAARVTEVKVEPAIAVGSDFEIVSTA
jgi:acylphosphatase